jgi:hypothetical protein
MAGNHSAFSHQLLAVTYGAEWLVVHVDAALCASMHHLPEHSRDAINIISRKTVHHIRKKRAKKSDRFDHNSRID